MDNIESICKLIGLTYTQQASNSITSREKLISELLVKRRCPLNGWDEINIDFLIHRLSMMDSNNFLHNCGIGERESRFLSPIVARRHYNMGHGIGRSGDISEIQPKAAGSSLINILANSLVLDILKKNGIPNTKSALIVPLATGMSLTLCLLTFKASRPDAKFVIWPRIDQKSCFKSIITAGFVPLIVENVKKGDSLTTDIDEVTRLIEKHGSNSIVAIMSTTSCFAPRIPDDLVALGKIAQLHNIPHVVNNAYGMASTKCMSLIEQASRSGRVDVYIQSTDKNFLVPVGGAIIAGFEPSIINKISSNYPGRGSAVPSLDVLITILNLGVNGYSKYLQDRRVQMDYLVNQLKILSSKFGEKVLETPANKISVAMTLDNFVKQDGKETAIGSMLFIRGISGARVISKNSPTKEISGYKFVAWCSHSNDYGHSYLTAAAAIGVTKDDIDVFIKRLQCLLSDLYNKKGITLENPIILYSTEAFFLIINNGPFHETVNSQDKFEFIPSIEGFPDLPVWMYYRFPADSKYAYLYGTPPLPGNFSVEVIAINKRTYDTYRDSFKLQVLQRENLAQYELQFKLTNLNVENMFNSQRLADLISIYRDILWKESKDIYFSKIVSPRDLGDRLPANPKEKEGVIIRIGSTNNFSRDLFDLEREVEPIKNRDPCPSRYKFTRFEHYFRSKQFFCDWCSFKIIKDSRFN